MADFADAIGLTKHFPDIDRNLIDLALTPVGMIADAAAFLDLTSKYRIYPLFRDGGSLRDYGIRLLSMIIADRIMGFWGINMHVDTLVDIEEIVAAHIEKTLTTSGKCALFFKAPIRTAAQQSLQTEPLPRTNPASGLRVHTDIVPATAALQSGRSLNRAECMHLFEAVLGALLLQYDMSKFNAMSTWANEVGDIDMAIYNFRQNLYGDRQPVPVAPGEVRDQAVITNANGMVPVVELPRDATFTDVNNRLYTITNERAHIGVTFIPGRDEAAVALVVDGKSMPLGVISAPGSAAAIAAGAKSYAVPDAYVNALLQNRGIFRPL